MTAKLQEKSRSSCNESHRPPASFVSPRQIAHAQEAVGNLGPTRSVAAAARSTIDDSKGTKKHRQASGAWQSDCLNFRWVERAEALQSSSSWPGFDARCTTYGVRLEATAPVLQRLMRHASIQTTMAFYTNVDGALDDAILKAKFRPEMKKPLFQGPFSQWTGWGLNPRPQHFQCDFRCNQAELTSKARRKPLVFDVLSFRNQIETTLKSGFDVTEYVTPSNLSVRY